MTEFLKKRFCIANKVVWVRIRIKGFEPDFFQVRFYQVDKEELEDSTKESLDLAHVFLGEGDEEESGDSGYLAELAGISREYAKALSDLNRNEEAEEFTAKSEKILGKLAEDDNEES
ncbi:TPR-domain containing protein [Methanosarcina horonobensis HB-1 = JCM 15518]|uniref:TPR-domain containing protein n=1 Tax=Methanosarcina horonobensis HB-1 = JCM 15518 TaxID=1434110 RepID=A0A0E3SAS1_9EURY|nr:hypothetical protein [Methanosarcina horonobensis]AKB77916.1 TPR-domain containing protein [Methanosarcina horonobensis HB-1 = JCM 15518]